ncbi:MAG TPA: hypothetical protein VN703_07760 [Candidatus Sulfopaludibacter sp.]|nr:hypothetical protein [Candidatus Sulfopaludibacter sp.]
MVKEIHRSNLWASHLLKRYDKEGICGLKDRTKSVGDRLSFQKISVLA